MDTLLKLYYKKITVIVCIVFLYNIAILYNNAFIFLIPGVVLTVTNIILPSQSVFLNDILLKSLPLDKGFISTKITRFFRISICSVTLVSLIYFFLLKQLGSFVNFDIPMVLMTFSMSLPITILSYSPFLTTIILPKSEIGIALGYVIPLCILSVCYIVLTYIVRLEGDMTKYLSLIILALPLYFFAIFSNLQTYKGILDDLNNHIDN